MNEAEETLSAHEILAQHITNVPQVTADVIRRAIEEYQAVASTKSPDAFVVALHRLHDHIVIARNALDSLTVEVGAMLRDARQDRKANGV